MGAEVEEFMGAFLWLVLKTPGRYNVRGRRLLGESDCQLLGCFGGQTKDFGFGARSFESVFFLTESCTKRS